MYLDFKNLSIGFVHNVIWGGEVTGYGKQPNDLDDYFRVFLGRGGGADAVITDQPNALGDAFGMWDFSYKKNIEINFQKKELCIMSSILFYLKTPTSIRMPIFTINPNLFDNRTQAFVYAINSPSWRPRDYQQWIPPRTIGLRYTYRSVSYTHLTLPTKA